MKGKLALLGLILTLLFWPVFGQTSSNNYYVVTAVDNSGNESAYSNQAGPCTTTSAKPHCALTWTASTSSGIAGYNVYRGSISGGPYVKINTTLVTVLTYSDIPVTFPNPPTGLGVVNN